MAPESNQSVRVHTGKTVKTHLFLCSARIRKVKGQGEDREAVLRMQVEADLHEYLSCAARCRR